MSTAEALVRAAPTVMEEEEEWALGAAVGYALQGRCGLDRAGTAEFPRRWDRGRDVVEIGSLE